MLNKKASILIYAIVLTTIALLLSSVILSNNVTLINTQKYYKLNTQFFNQIKSNNTLNIDYLKKLNSDGGGFIDLTSGSGSDIKCRLQGDGSYLIEGNSGSINISDGYDDNCNSDNYLGNNSGSISYMDGFIDNDDLARKELIGIVVPGQQKNIFWNNKKIEEFIEENPNNINNSFNKTLSGVTDGKLFLNISSGALLTLIEYDKDRYSEFGEIKENKTSTGIISGSGYIKAKPPLEVLELDMNPPEGHIYQFDFVSNGYLLFLTNTGSNLISYNLSGDEKTTGSGIYLNPINDVISNTGSLSILGYDIIINDRGEIFGKMLEKVFDK
ncbi:MAG: hypothetical protein Q9M97_02620 [Candidatus Gracilibacteria bacterium]|nr:hypothetical protein [Candidatus Gracilibacteria bacterium]